MNLSSLDLNLLRVLTALLDDPSTVRAGPRLGLSQSAVSAALSRLRLSLQDPLFLRQGQHLVPTEFAISLRAPLAALMDDLDHLLSGPARFDPLTARHSIKIAGSDFFAELLIARARRSDPEPRSRHAGAAGGSGARQPCRHPRTSRGRSGSDPHGRISRLDRDASPVPRRLCRHCKTRASGPDDRAAAGRGANGPFLWPWPCGLFT